MSHPKKSIRLLVVDDDELVLGAYRRCLACGFALDCAESAERALEIIEAGDFDAIVSDYQMPVRNGIWLLEQVRSRRPAMLRILTSGGPIGELGGCQRSGLVQYFLPKPVLRENLLSCLNRAGLGGATGRAEAEE